MLVKMDLGEIGAQHLKWALNYDNRLCNAISSKLDFSTGSVFAYLPEKQLINDQEDLKRGRGQVSDYISGYFKDWCGDKILLFDDVMASPEDKFVDSEDSSILLLEDEVYHIKDVASSDESEISEIIWATAVSWHFVCVVVEKAKIIDERGSFDKFLDDGLVEGVKEIVVGAFDGEGFVHWQPERAAPHG
jgi:hypothetical protein